MKKYDNEQQLDALLQFYCTASVGKTIPITSIPNELQTPNLHKQLFTLEHHGLIAPLSVVFDNPTKPVTYKGFYSATNNGMWFYQNTSFVEQAKLQRRAKRRYDFEYFKLGYDTLIAFVSLGISVAALLVALLK